jgi:hypothetical protein
VLGDIQVFRPSIEIKSAGLELMNSLEETL